MKDFLGREIQQGDYLCVGARAGNSGTLYGATVKEIQIKPAKKYVGRSEENPSGYIPDEKEVYILLMESSGRKQTIDARNIANRCVVVEK
jgi:hypothetical protein